MTQRGSISHLLRCRRFTLLRITSFLVFFWKACNALHAPNVRTRRTAYVLVGHLRTLIMHVLGEEGTRIASNKTRRKWVDEHKSGTIGSVGRCPCGLGSGQWTPWPCETHAARVLHTVSHALPLPPPPTPRRVPSTSLCLPSRRGLLLFLRPALHPFCTYAASTLGCFTRRNAYRAG